MADWVDIEDSQLDPDAPLTSELAYSWRDNPIAIAEGAVDAPKVMGQALGAMIAVRQPSPLIITDLERVAALVVWGHGQVSSGVDDIIRLGFRSSTNGGATWSGSTSLDFRRSHTTGLGAATLSGVVNVGGGINAVEFSMNSYGAGPFISVACLLGVSP